MAFQLFGSSLRWRRVAVLAVGIGVLMVSSAGKAAVTFNIASTPPVFGAGYGVDVKEDKKDSPTLLAVTFGSVAPPALFNLGAGESASGLILGKFDFLEEWIEDTDEFTETNELGLAWTFVFEGLAIDPVTVAVAATVSAYKGPVIDELVDYSIEWPTVLVGFGSGGQFSLSLDHLQFSRAGELAQTATIRLVSVPAASLPAPPIESVPEPGSLALLIGGLAGVIAMRRRRIPA